MKKILKNLKNIAGEWSSVPELCCSYSPAGTDLYEEVKGNLITTDYDLFDFIHTQLPTKLPLKNSSII